MPNLFVRITRAILRPILPVVKKRVVRIRSTPARGFVGYAGQWTLPEAPDIEEKYFRSLNFNGKTVYDIGANIGATTLFFSGQVGREGCVISFEPHPEIFEILQEHIKLNQLSNVEACNLAIGNINGEARLRVPIWGRGAGSLKETIKNASEDHDQVKINLSKNQDQLLFTEFVVQQVTIDHVINQKGYPVPDFIKFDTEGFEYECLQGMRDTMREHHPDLFLEMHGYSDKEKKENAQNIVSILLDYDYCLIHVESSTPLHIDNYYIAKKGHIFATSWGDLVASQLG